MGIIFLIGCLLDENKELMNKILEISSSTLSEINKNSKYYKRKIKILGFFK